jgi:hypothetical protein
VRRGLGLFVLCATLLAAGACSDEGSPGAAAGSPGPPADDPLTFADTGGGCTSVAGEYLTWENVTVDRPIELTGVELVDSDGVEILDQTVMTKPKGEAVSTGIVVGDRPPGPDRTRIGWEDRVPLDGARLEPGTTYYLAVHLLYPDRGGYEASQVTWDDGQPGVSPWHDRLEVGPDC